MDEWPRCSIAVCLSPAAHYIEADRARANERQDAAIVGAEVRERDRCPAAPEVVVELEDVVAVDVVEADRAPNTRTDNRGAEQTTRQSTRWPIERLEVE